MLPLVGLLVRAPWADAWQVITSAGALQALRLSLITATPATVLFLMLGVPLAWLLARPGLPAAGPSGAGHRAAGAAACGRRRRAAAGVRPARHRRLAAVRAHRVLAAVHHRRGRGGPGIRRHAVPGDRGGGRAAGARPPLRGGRRDPRRSGRHVFRRVTLPLVGPGVAAGAVLCWARALGEFGATITFAGNFPGTTQTMPLAVYLALETDPGRRSLLSVLLLVVSVAVLALCGTAGSAGGA